MTAPGLCGRCVHARVLGNRRGSTFYLCGLSAEDPRFPRYPRLPVLRCAGFREGMEATESPAGRDASPDSEHGLEKP